VAAATPTATPSSATTSSATKNSSSSSSTSGATTATTTASAAADSASSSAAASSASAAAANASSQAAFTLPGKKLSVLPIGLGVFAGISVIALIVVGLVTYERTKYRKVCHTTVTVSSQITIFTPFFRRSGNENLLRPERGWDTEEWRKLFAPDARHLLTLVPSGSAPSYLLSWVIFFYNFILERKDIGGSCNFTAVDSQSCCVSQAINCRKLVHVLDYRSVSFSGEGAQHCLEK
jgi:hypothetical protein